MTHLQILAAPFNMLTQKHIYHSEITLTINTDLYEMLLQISASFNERPIRACAVALWVGPKILIY